MRTVFGALLIGAASALDNGLALTPPMGWRSWNCFHGDVDDTKIRTVVDAMAAPRAGGESLLSLGYARVGVDDGWQACGTGRAAINGTSGGEKSFHAEDGSPLVNKSTFPDLKALVDYGHSKKVLLLLLLLLAVLLLLLLMLNPL